MTRGYRLIGGVRPREQGVNRDRACSRCGIEIHSQSRPGGKCTDCADLGHLEGRAEVRGIDLATLDDRDFDLLQMSPKRVATRYPERLRRRQMKESKAA